MRGTTVNASQVYGSHIGPHNNIGPFTHVRVNTVTDYGVHLGAYVETKNSNFARGNTVSHLTYIGDSDVGKYCNFGCGTVTCNYDGKDKFRTPDRRLLLHRLQHQPCGPGQGGRRCHTAAGSTITKDVPAQALGIARDRQTNLDGWATQDGSLHSPKRRSWKRAESKAASVSLPQRFCRPLHAWHPGGFFRVGAYFFLIMYIFFCRAYVILRCCITLLSKKVLSYHE